VYNKLDFFLYNIKQYSDFGIIRYLKNLPINHLSFMQLLFADLCSFKATTIDELIEGIKKVDEFLIFYHIFHPLFSSHVVPEDISNDLATWIRDELGDKLLAQKVSDIEGKEPRTVENIREDLIKFLSEARISRTTNKPFYFITCRPVVYNRRVAKSLAEFIDIIASISIKVYCISLYL